MKKDTRPDDPDGEGPEEIDDVEEVSGGYQFPDGCIPLPPLPGDPPIDYTDPFDPLGDRRHLEL